MKRSFYEMLGIPRDADKAQIDAAYAQATAKLDSTTSVRGSSEALAELNLIREGYRILSDPAQRVRYDGKLAADQSGVKLMFFPKDVETRRKLGFETVLLVALAAVLGGILYWQLTHKAEDMPTEQQAVVKNKDAQNKGAAVDAAKKDFGAKAGSEEKR